MVTHLFKSRIEQRGPEVRQKSSTVGTLQIIVTRAQILVLLTICKKLYISMGTFSTLHAADKIVSPVKNYPHTVYINYKSIYNDHLQCNQFT